MLQTLQRTQALGLAVYGMNRGTIGFLMNEFSVETLPQRLALAEQTCDQSLGDAGDRRDRESGICRWQSTKCRCFVRARKRPNCVSPSTGGQGLTSWCAMARCWPLRRGQRRITTLRTVQSCQSGPMSWRSPRWQPIGPRRWRGALLPKCARVGFDVLEPERRPVTAYADSLAVENVVSVQISSDTQVSHKILFDPGHGLEERLLREQFV